MPKVESILAILTKQTTAILPVRSLRSKKAKSRRWLARRPIPTLPLARADCAAVLLPGAELLVRDGKPDPVFEAAGAHRWRTRRRDQQQARNSPAGELAELFLLVRPAEYRDVGVRIDVQTQLQIFISLFRCAPSALKKYRSL